MKKKIILTVAFIISLLPMLMNQYGGLKGVQVIPISYWQEGKRCCTDHQQVGINRIFRRNFGGIIKKNVRLYA